MAAKARKTPETGEAKKTAKIAALSVPLEPHRRYCLELASDMLCQSQAKTFADIKAGKLRVIKDGRRTYVPGTEIIRLSTLPAA